MKGTHYFIVEISFIPPPPPTFKKKKKTQATDFCSLTSLLFVKLSYILQKEILSYYVIKSVNFPIRRKTVSIFGKDYISTVRSHSCEFLRAQSTQQLDSTDRKQWRLSPVTIPILQYTMQSVAGRRQLTAPSGSDRGWRKTVHL